MQNNPAQRIANAVLRELEGDKLLIEAMCRAMCGVYKADPDEPCNKEAGSLLNWETFKYQAQMHLVCDRIMRGPGDKFAWEQIQKERSCS
jgi:hypothetical protein